MLMWGVQLMGQYIDAESSSPSGGDEIAIQHHIEFQLHEKKDWSLADAGWGIQRLTFHTSRDYRANHAFGACRMASQGTRGI